MKILINDKLIELTPEILAEQFANLRSDEQARFFNHIDVVAGKWKKLLPFQLQAQAIADEDGLTLAGQRVMKEIGGIE